MSVILFYCSSGQIILKKGDSNMVFIPYPVIDAAATGANIRRLRIRKGFSVADLQRYFGFEAPQAIYKWQTGQSLPNIDNLYALSRLLGVPMNDILVQQKNGQSDDCPSSFFVLVSGFREFPVSGYASAGCGSSYSPSANCGTPSVEPLRSRSLLRILRRQGLEIGFTN